MAKKKISSNLSDLLSKDALELLTSNGVPLVQTIGIEAIRDVVLDILSGKNLRDSTEFITRRRISFLNLSLFEMLIDNADKSTIYELIDRSVEILQQKRIPKTERWLSQWILGLNDKAFQNISRDDPQGLNSYKQQYVDSCDEVIRSFEDKHGSLSCVVKYG